MSAVWGVLESGAIINEYTRREENGLYLKMYDAIAGVHIYVDLLIENHTDRILVLWAEQDEEE